MRPLVYVFASQNEGHSLITVRNHLNEKVSMEFPIDPIEFIKKYHTWTTGELIHHVFKDVSTDHHEFLVTGIVPVQDEIPPDYSV